MMTRLSGLGSNRTDPKKSIPVPTLAFETSSADIENLRTPSLGNLPDGEVTFAIVEWV